MHKMFLSVAAAAVLLHGCSTVSTNGALSDGKNAAASYVASSDDGIVKSTAGGCVRTIDWSTDNILVECDASDSGADSVPKTAARLTFSGRALFDFDSDVLTSDGEQELESLVAKIGSDDLVDSISIVGHADSTGAENYNQALSERRAAAVHSYLHNALNEVPMSAKGEGETSPIATNGTAEGRRQNRRVEVTIQAEVAQ